jgi:LacI family transcriptional regulator, galactose operon repressor
VATIADVAQRAGVSVSTAARVLSGSGYAGEQTRQRVLEAAQELGYVANHIARSLRLRHTNMIGLLIADVENSFYSVIAKGVESVCKEAGYHVVLCNSNDDPEEEKEYLTVLEGIRVDGLIITPTSHNRLLLERLRKKGITIVQMDRTVDGLRSDAILVDNEAGAAHAVAHLIAAGHGSIGIMTGPLDVTTGRERLRGYERALKEHGIKLHPSLVRTGSFRGDRAIQDAKELMAAEPRPTAIFAANNILAEACLLAVAERGLRVPRDVSVVAFDDTPWMSMINPPVTTVRQPTPDMAHSAAELLLRRLRNPSAAPPATMVFHTELVVRGSVATVTRAKALS